ncbi:MAG TPA: hypothetical protein VI358_14790 [Pseudolabrys sp.]
MPRQYNCVGIALACIATLAAAGCTGAARVLEDQNDGGWFSKPVELLAKPDWARPTAGKGVNLGPQGPVGLEDLVSADGRCTAPAAAPAQPAEPSPAAAEPPAPADRAVGSVAGDLAGAPMPAANSASATPNSGLQRLEPASGPPPVAGGIALGMTECQTVQRAGTPSNVAISAGEKGERKVVLTYLSGPWPGIYTFTGGRLSVVERAPEQPKPAKAAPKKAAKKKPPPKTASHEFQRDYVQ